MMIKDSGNRREFESGAVRDIAEGKGRCDLLPLDIIGEFYGDDILQSIDHYVREGDPRWLKHVFEIFAIDYIGGIETAILEVSKHYEEGCKKYGERNWEKGIPLHCYIDSGVRHYLKFKREDKDEPHDKAFLWNMLGAMWTAKHHPELCDLPWERN